MRIIITLLSILFFAPFTSSTVYAKDDNFAGNISINLSKCTNSYCEYLITFKSRETTTKEFKPIIEWLILDCDSNTVRETTTFFDTIYPGKKQRKRVLISFDEMFEPGEGQVKFMVLKARSNMVYLDSYGDRTSTPFPLLLDRYTWFFCSQ